MKVACVTSDAGQAVFLEQVVTMSGHQTMLYSSGRQLMGADCPMDSDIFLVSWALQDISGCDVLRWIRTQLRKPVPVILLGSGADGEDSVAAFSAGADDFVILPVRRDELMARLNARLRQSYPYYYAECLTYGAYKMDMVTRVMTHHSVPVPLTAREFDVLEVFFRNIGRVVDREYISKAVWGRELDALSRTVDTHISRVRSKLKFSESSDLKLAAVYGHGYRLDPVREVSN